MKSGFRERSIRQFYEKYKSSEENVLAIVSAFRATILSYIALREMGVPACSFFLSLQIVVTVPVCSLVPGEACINCSEWRYF